MAVATLQINADTDPEGSIFGLLLLTARWGPLLLPLAVGRDFWRGLSWCILSVALNAATLYIIASWLFRLRRKIATRLEKSG